MKIRNMFSRHYLIRFGSVQAIKKKLILFYLDRFRFSQKEKTSVDGFFF